jgi:hypothetical protein
MTPFLPSTGCRRLDDPCGPARSRGLPRPRAFHHRPRGRRTPSPEVSILFRVPGPWGLGSPGTSGGRSRWGAPARSRGRAANVELPRAAGTRRHGAGLGGGPTVGTRRAAAAGGGQRRVPL